jgi:hypothetical protein
MATVMGTRQGAGGEKAKWGKTLERESGRKGERQGRTDGSHRGRVKR